ncbi:MAG: alpha/beta fold hydrolase [Lautropia sp.]
MDLSARVRFVQVSGIRTRIVEAGSPKARGGAIVLLHGIGLSADCWLRNFEPLAQDHFVVAPDLIGHGHTDHTGFGETPPQIALAAHVVALCRVLQLSQCTVVGSSLGGLVAALAYFAASDIVRGLVFVGSGSIFNSPETHRNTMQASLQNALPAFREPTLASCRRRLQNIVRDPDSIPDALIWSQATSNALSDRALAFEEVVTGSAATADTPGALVSTRLRLVEVPVLLIAGRQDIRTAWQQQVDGVASFSDAELVLYEECGHLPFIEHPSRFNPDVLRFINQKVQRPKHA